MEYKELIEQGLKSVGDKLDTAITKFQGQLEEKGKVDTEVRNEVKELSEQFKEINATVTAIGQKQAEGFKSANKAQTPAEEFVKSEQYKQLVAGNTQRARIEVKNTVTSDGTTVFPQQQPGVIQGDFKYLTIRALLRAIPVSTNMVNSLREASNTNNAAEIAQGAAKPESAVTFEQYNVPITTVAHFIKISNQLLADSPAIMAYIDSRLRDGLAQRIDAQLLNGDGTAPNLSGMRDAGNFTAYTPVLGDNLVDAINRAKYQLWATGHQPDAVIVNPADWGAMERSKSSQGEYLYGMPGMAGALSPFGVPLVLSNNMPIGSFLVGSVASTAVLYNRSGAVIEMGYVNDDFTKNLITLRAEERLGLGMERASAIRSGTFFTAV